MSIPTREVEMWILVQYIRIDNSVESERRGMVGTALPMTASVFDITEDARYQLRYWTTGLLIFRRFHKIRNAD